MVQELYIGINIKCDAKKFESLLNEAKINFYNIKVKNVRYFYDDLTFFFFQFDYSRQTLIDLLKANKKVIEQIIEFSFYEKID